MKLLLCACLPMCVGVPYPFLVLHVFGFFLVFGGAPYLVRDTGDFSHGRTKNCSWLIGCPLGKSLGMVHCTHSAPEENPSMALRQLKKYPRQFGHTKQNKLATCDERKDEGCGGGS